MNFKIFSWRAKQVSKITNQTPIWRKVSRQKWMNDWKKERCGIFSIFTFYTRFAHDFPSVGKCQKRNFEFLIVRLALQSFHILVQLMADDVWCWNRNRWKKNLYRGKASTGPYFSQSSPTNLPIFGSVCWTKKHCHFL